MNSQPARFVFLQSDEAKNRLLPALIDSNVQKTEHAPLTAIVAMDTQVYLHLPTQFTAYDGHYPREPRLDFSQVAEII